ncbi:MAG: hypothetical protein RL115_769 [Bacteroidota bacterium]
MKIKLYNKLHFIADLLPISFYIRLTGQSKIFPFYHCVTNAPKPHLSALGYYRKTDQFVKDLLFFKKHYTSVTIPQMQQNKAASFHLSFDDGLSECYTEVFPLLLKERLTATFFINADFIDNKKMFIRHKISLLHVAAQSSAISRARLASKLACEDAQVCLRLLSLTNEQLVDELAKEVDIDFIAYLHTFKPYLTTLQIKEMSRSGMQIESHGKDHTDLTLVKDEEAIFQIKDCNLFLQNTLGAKPKYFAFPYGSDRVGNRVFDFLYKQEGLLGTFGVAGLKMDSEQRHIHRIAMEAGDISAESMLKFEYFYFMLKALVRKNVIHR